MSTHLLSRRPEWESVEPRPQPRSPRASEIILALTAAAILLVLAIGLGMQVLNWMTAG
jgi:hypothetical protein